jgi:hypothetical protein
MADISHKDIPLPFMHPPAAIEFSGIVSSYIPTKVGFIYLHIPSNVPYKSTGLQQGNMVEIGPTNLSTALTSTSVAIQNDRGTSATISVANGTNAGVLSSSLFTKLSGIEANAKDDQIAAEVAVTPTGSLSATNVQTALAELQSKINAIQAWPVGSVLTMATGVNANTAIGYGTWVKFGEGQVPVGQLAGDPHFGTLGAAGGAKTHTLSWNEMPQHSHGINDFGHGHQVPAINGSSGSINGFPAGANQGFGGNVNTTFNTTNISVQNSGNDFPHNNMQPYKVVVFWERTS